jgi:molecular chaperone DnaK (HSP70)
MAKIIGIDLGTTNSVVAVIEAGEPTVLENSAGRFQGGAGQIDAPRRLGGCLGWTRRFLEHRLVHTIHRVIPSWGWIAIVLGGIRHGAPPRRPRRIAHPVAEQARRPAPRQ